MWSRHNPVYIGLRDNWERRNGTFAGGTSSKVLGQATSFCKRTIATWAGHYTVL